MTHRKRAALLARPGAASDQLRDALRHAGADVVLVADPGVIGADEVISAEPDSVLIALDGTVDDMLDRFDSVLGDPDITVIFEEVDVALAREGWDAARWARHLRAKLYGHQDVLPPGQSEEDDDSHPELQRPGLAIASQPDHIDASLADYLGDLEGLPTDQVGAPSSSRPDRGDYQSFDMDGGNSSPNSGTASHDEASDDSISFDDFNFDTDDNAVSTGAAAETSTDNRDGGNSSPNSGTASNDAASDDSINFDDFNFDTDDNAVSTGAAAETSTGNDWSVPSDAPSTAGNAPGSVVDLDLAHLEQRISGLTLAEHDSYGHGPLRGAVIVLAGLGGPDAVRQLLSGLPEGFPRPVLIAQKLDGGQYEKLVRQMSRATSLPVDMACVGEKPQAGHVYVVAPTIGVGVDRGALVFNKQTDDASWFATLPPSDTAIVMLSGSDIAGVDHAMQMAASGALVMGQSVEGCFEPEAAAALSARGGESGFPVDLARKLADRWPG